MEKVSMGVLLFTELPLVVMVKLLRYVVIYMINVVIYNSYTYMYMYTDVT